MSKFGDLIEGEKNLFLFIFYEEVENVENSMHTILLDVAKAIADGGR